MAIVSFFGSSTGNRNTAFSSQPAVILEAAGRYADSLLKGVALSIVNTELTNWSWLKGTTSCVRHQPLGVDATIRPPESMYVLYYHNG